MKLGVYSFMIYLLFTSALGCNSGRTVALSAVLPPTFNGLQTTMISTVSLPATINGNCDARSLGLQTSRDNVVWTTSTIGCSANGTFSFSWTFQPDFYIREKTMVGYTSSAHAILTITAPTSAPLFAFVSSGQAAPESGVGSQNVMSGTYEQLPSSLQIYNLPSQVPGMIY